MEGAAGLGSRNSSQLVAALFRGRCARQTVMSAEDCAGLSRREVEDDEEATPWKEQENWEADQIKKAAMGVGAKDRRKGAKEYDLVLPDQIEFITDMVMAGDVVGHLHFMQSKASLSVNLSL